MEEPTRPFTFIHRTIIRSGERRLIHPQVRIGHVPDREPAWGFFGENFTTAGLLENTVYIGDRFRVGSAEFVVTQPRMPCFKLGIRFNRSDMVKRFLQSGRTGFYFAVRKEGEVAAGDSIEALERDNHNITVADL